MRWFPAMCHAGYVEFSQMVILQTVLLDGLKRQMSKAAKACIDRSDSLTFQHKRRPRVPKYEKRCGYMAGNRSRFSKY